MPAIWNVNKGYEVNDKKVSSKLTFEVGEKFSGRIVDKGEGEEVVVKLADGWQFTAEVDGEVNVESQGLIKFAVEGFDNGKLKLKVVQGEQKGSNLTGDSILNIIEKEGLSADDMDLLQTMTKHNIPLTRENIGYIKSVIQFSEKINQSPQEIDEFIDKLISGKGIDPQSAQAKDLRSILSEFFNSFKNLSHEDILLFLENNIDLNKENIESYNKLFKGDNTLTDVFESVGKELKNLQEELPNVQNIKKGNSANIKNNNIELAPKDIFGKGDINSKISINDSQLAFKAYDANETVKGKTSIMALLRSMMKTETALIKEPLKNILSERINGFNFTEYNDALSKLENLSDNTVLEMVKDNSSNQREFNKGTLNKVVSNIFNKDIELSDVEFEHTTNMLRVILEENMNENNLKGSTGKNNNLESSILKKLEIQLNSGLDGGEILDGENVNTGTKVAPNELLNGDMKLQEQVSSKEEGKLQGDKNLKNDGDSKQTVAIDEKTNVKVEENAGKDQIAKESINNKKDSQNDNINIKGKINQEVDLTDLLEKGEKISSKDLIRNDIKAKIDDIKEIIKGLIEISNNEGLKNGKVLELIKGNINDFKLFNSISNEYYYLDIPIKQNNNEYPCKLIIKDNRKDGKKIDRSNIKMVVSVKTINLGKIDGYLKVKDSTLDIDLKCDEKYQGIIDMGKEKLVNGLKRLGFFVNVIVTKKNNEVDITTCRDFFNDGNTRAIDTKV